MSISQGSENRFPEPSTRTIKFDRSIPMLILVGLSSFQNMSNHWNQITPAIGLSDILMTLSVVFLGFEAIQINQIDLDYWLKNKKSIIFGWLVTGIVLVALLTIFDSFLGYFWRDNYGILSRNIKTIISVVLAIFTWQLMKRNLGDIKITPNETSLDNKE